MLCSVGQACKRVGAPDPRIAPADGKLDYRLTQQLRCWSKEDPPPRRVRPAPITLVTHILRSAFDRPSSPAEQAIADMICIAFYFLLRPGEYTGTTNDDAAFTLDDVRLFSGTRRLCLQNSSVAAIQAATSVSLYFTTQKNQRKGDSVAHGRSHHPWCCPVRAAIRRVLTHRAQFESTNTVFTPSVILASYYHNGKNLRVLAKDITACLRLAATACFPSTGIPAAEISARSLRAGGAMALLCGRIDTDLIKLLGRWQSDAMIRYLHQDATPIMRRLAARMFRNGSYSFLPDVTVPYTDAADVPTP